MSKAIGRGILMAKEKPTVTFLSIAVCQSYQSGARVRSRRVEQAGSGLRVRARAEGEAYTGNV